MGAMTGPAGAEDAPDTELGRHMDDRRNDLGMTWDDIARLSGLSRQTLYDIRKGNTDLRRMRSSTKRKIETAFKWERGTVERAVLDGIPPAPAAEPTGPVAIYAALEELGWSAEDEAEFQSWKRVLGTGRMKLSLEKYLEMKAEFQDENDRRKQPTPVDDGK